MKFKKHFLYLILGFCLGVMVFSVLDKIGVRTGNFGGEVFFVPCAGMLVWFGWTIHSEIVQLKKFKRRRTNDKRRLGKS